MKKTLFGLILTLVISAVAFGADPAIKGDLKYEPYRLVKLQAEGVDPKAGLLWRIYPPSVDRATTGRDTLQFAAIPGTYQVELLAIVSGADGVIQISEARATVVIGGITPPTPIDPPNPPGPKPPIPLDGFRCLIIYETAEVQKLPSAQAQVLYAKQIRDYLDAKCAIGADEKTREYRIWDKDSDVTGAATHWQDAMKRPRQSIPWILISDGKTGFEGALPADVPATLELLKKYGG